MKQCRTWAGLMILVLLGLVGCAGDDALVVENAWARTSPAAAENAAFYMVITNNGDTDEALVAVEADVCGTVELHETAMGENDVMMMRPVAGQRIPIPAGESVELTTGGLHVMCLGKTRDFVAGDELTLTLHFEHAGEKVVTAEVRDQ